MPMGTRDQQGTTIDLVNVLENVNSINQYRRVEKNIRTNQPLILMHALGMTPGKRYIG